MSEKKRSLGRWGFAVWVFFSAICWSGVISSQSSDISVVDMQNIDQQFKSITLDVSTSNQSYENMVHTFHAMNVLKTQVEICIREGQEKLKRISGLLSDVQPSVNKAPDEYLRKERQNLQTQISSCSFIDYRLDEIRSVMSERINAVHTVNVLTRVTPVWNVDYALLLSRISLNYERLYQFSGIEQLNPSSWIYLILTATGGFLVAFALVRRWTRWVKSSKIKSDKFHFAHAVIHDLVYLFPLVLVDLYLNVIMRHSLALPLAVLWVNAIVLYLGVLWLTRLFAVFSLHGTSWPPVFLQTFNAILIIVSLVYILFVLYSLNHEVMPSLHLVDYHRLVYVLVTARLVLALLINHKHWFTREMIAATQTRVGIIATAGLVCYVSYTLLMTQLIPAQLLAWIETVFISLLNIAYFWLLWILFGTPWCKSAAFVPYRTIIKNSLKVICLAIIVAGWCGYRYLAIHLVPNVIITVVLLSIILEVSILFNRLYHSLSDPDQKPSQRLRAILGCGKEKTLYELFFIRITFNLPAIVIGILCIMETWGGTRYQAAYVYTLFRDGFILLGLQFHLTHLIRAGNVFCLIILAGRALATYIGKHKMSVEEIQAQTIISSIVHYITFAIALLTALYIIGFELKSLLVLGGALTFGLGFALQNFAKDFIGGLIIIFNKPIKPGDHVIIEIYRSSYEGFVKKIGALSTQLRTLTHTDIIIPNSIIINNCLTNLTFESNRLFRIKIMVVLDNILDAESGKQVLLDIAAKNPYIIQTPPSQPEVLFELNCLNLWCIINDVEKKQQIISDLHLAITSAFKERGIAMHLG